MQLFEKNELYLRKCRNKNIMNEQNLKEVLIALQLCCDGLVSTTLGTSCLGTRLKLACEVFSFLFFFSFCFFFFPLFLSFSFLYLPSFLFFLFSTFFFLPPPHYLSCLHKPFLYHSGIEQNIQNINGCGYGCGQNTTLLLFSGNNPPLS